MQPWFVFLYCAILTFTIVSGIDPQLSSAHQVTKPLLMISLTLYVIAERKKGGAKSFNWLLFALFLSLLGDILLLPELSEHYFLFGLLAFLGAHLSYIVLFMKVSHRPSEVPFIRRNPWFIFLAILYGLWFFIQVRSGAGPLAWAVLIYALVILTMLVSAFNRQGAVSKKSFALTSIGALLFICSDSILAWNKFESSIDFAPIFILGTYGIAQLLITTGILAQDEIF